jgi:hypothetical protein
VVWGYVYVQIFFHLGQWRIETLLILEDVFLTSSVTTILVIGYYGWSGILRGFEFSFVRFDAVSTAAQSRKSKRNANVI